MQTSTTSECQFSEMHWELVLTHNSKFGHQWYHLKTGDMIDMPVTPMHTNLYLSRHGELFIYNVDNPFLCHLKGTFHPLFTP